MKKIRSIYSQLILFYSIAVVVLLVLIAPAFYWETQNVIRQADYNFLQEEANNIQSILADDISDEELLKKTVVEHPLRTRNSLYRYYVRVMDENGRVILATPGTDEIFRVPDVKQMRSAEQKFVSHEYKGNNYLTLVTETNLKNSKSRGYIQIALNTSFQHSITHDRRIFFVMLLVGFMLALLLGQFVTRRGLKSLDTLTDTVKTITTSSLSQRVNPKLFPAELSPLGEAFNQMLERIEVSFSRLNQMAADMSHELRTPITNLIGQTELLLAYPHSAADYQNAQASNLEELQRMATLVENILFLARAESRLPTIEKKKISVKTEIEMILEYYQALAEDKNIKITMNGDANTEVNNVMFRRLMNNLVSNAIKYTPAGGRIGIDVNLQNEMAVIGVEDSGIGIEPRHLPHLFDRFYRVDDARAADIPGTGLGLAIVKTIVDLHGGQIRIHSELAKGTRIEVALPKVA